ncbi:SpoIIE family protein phosphatase [Streptomyces sp. NPDC057686]|uniref:SpoIIE family protein phosphatase n=1 Tax=Streptomyces sp. NPDC057686 TaxID=3346212 RepID=UPI0036876072
MSDQYADTSSFIRTPLTMAGSAVVVLDYRGVVTGWSGAAEILFGCPTGEIVGQGMDFLLDGWPGHDAPGSPVPPQGRGLIFRVRNARGTARRVMVQTCQLSSEAGRTNRIPAYVVVAADASEVKAWEARQAMLQGLALQSPMGLAIYSQDLRLIWANHASGTELGLPVEKFLGVHAEDLYPEGEVISNPELNISDVMRQVLDSGIPVVDLHYRAPLPVDPRQLRVWSCSYYRLEDFSGNVIGVCEDSCDITERYTIQQRLALLVRFGARVGKSLDVGKTVREMAAVTVPDFVDEITVDLLEPVMSGEELESSDFRNCGMVRAVRCVASGGNGRVDVIEMEKLEKYAYDSPQHSALIGDSSLADGGECRIGQISNDRYSVFVPLRARGAVLGLVSFYRRRKVPFTYDDVCLAGELVARAAVCIDNARRYTRERTAALALQKHLLPQQIPAHRALEVAHRYLPADAGAGVGGDWFDVIPLSGMRIGLVVGDVVGHGMHAAATMGRLRATVQALALLDLSPAELLARMDQLIQLASNAGDDGAMGTTCLYAVYDPISGYCNIARAGHLPPVIAFPNGSFTICKIPAAPPLGLGGLPLEAIDIYLPPGSIIALFTDGLVENRTRDIDGGLQLLEDAFRNPHTSLEELSDRITLALLPTSAADDDAALLVVRTHRLSASHVISWELPAEPASVGRARSLAVAQLHSWELAGLSFSTELIVSELVTNALRHASGPIQLRLARDRFLLCEVSDASHTSPHMRYARTDDEDGRGLFIISQLARQWGTRYTRNGKIIWTEQDLPQSTASKPWRADH